jgi:hypothetical protein
MMSEEKMKSKLSTISVRRPNFSLSKLALVLTTGFVSTVHAGELYFDFNQNNLGGTATASVFLFGAPGQSASVSNLAGFSQTVTLGSNGFFNLPIANTYQQSGTGVRNTGFQVVSPTAIAGYFVNRAGFSTDMTYLIDKGSLGNNYVVASQNGLNGEGSQVAIHATVNNTTITFTPTGGVPITQTLQAGETYKYAGGSTNLTGSFVSANQPVAVFSGHACANVPSGASFCDTLLEQMIPTNKLSTAYTLVASKGSNLATSQSDLVRVIATQNGTSVAINGTNVATLAAGQYYEYNLAKNSGASVVASKPVLVAQYLTGGNGANTDPAMAVVPGSDAWLNAYRLATPSGAQAFDVNYASIVINQSDIGTLKLNNVAVGSTGFTVIPGTSFLQGNIDLPLGLFDLTAASPFEVMLGGGSSADSYYTFGGSTFAVGISPPPPPPPPTNDVPEPAGVALTGLGLLGLFGARRRKAGTTIISTSV